MNLTSKKGFVLANVIATIGAVLISVGVAWMVARNWHQIPNVIKIFILVFATFVSFISGVLLRQHEREGAGRSLIVLGALLYVLSVFLIAQIYATPSGLQGYAWLLFLCWPVIMLTAYFLDSRENLVISMILFFIWASIQYTASISSNAEEKIIIGFVLLYLSAGVLLYGLSVVHSSIRHRFTSVYRFWTVFYFLLIFYVISFQSALPILGEYSFNGEAFSIFLILFLVVCFFGFVIGAVFSASRNLVSFKEIIGFIGVIMLLFVLVLSTSAGAGLMGYCSAINCYDFKTSSECSSAPSDLICEWKNEYCRQANCYDSLTEAECDNRPLGLKCKWDSKGNNCLGQVEQKVISARDEVYNECAKNNNQKGKCTAESQCKWNPSYQIWNVSKGLPSILWALWIINNFIFIGFIILVLWYGQRIGSTTIINLGLFAFVLDIISRYIGFLLNFKGYFAFSVLAISGGLLLIIGALVIPKWRKKLLNETPHTHGYGR